MKLSSMILALALGAFFATEARAEEEVKREPDRVVVAPKTIITFSELQVTGEVVSPVVSYIRGRGRAKFRPLIIYRGDFRPELLASVDAL